MIGDRVGSSRMDIDHKGLNQLLLSPLYLFEQLLSVMAPGLLLMLLLGFKGTLTMQEAWSHAPFGYKTKIAAALLLAYVVGSALRLPFILFNPLAKKFAPKTPMTFPLQPSPQIKKMLSAVITDGAVLATPGLADRLSLGKADAGFHLGTGMALLVAACVRGDGALRWLELTVGLAMLTAAFLRGQEYQDQLLSTVAIGWAHVLGRMTPEQFHFATTLLQALGAVPKQASSSSSPLDAPQTDQHDSAAAANSSG